MMDNAPKKEILSMQQVRRDQDQEMFRKMEKHARCALLPSPEELSKGFTLGADSTDTLKDFKTVSNWLTEADLLTFSYDKFMNDNHLDSGVYYSMINNAFSMAFAHLSHTANPELNEIVLWYYAGHGLDKDDANILSYSAAPELKEIKLETKFQAAPECLLETRKVKGGELCLHKVGFCDLRGLLAPFLHAIRCKSLNSEGRKKNKHLVIILDSCYSGELANDLNILMEEQPLLKNELEKNGCTITVQASCNAIEKAKGGYFTPTFVFLNKPEKSSMLKYFITKWNGMTEETKDRYRALNLSSPIVTSTKPIDELQPIMEIKTQNLQVILFHDFGFFKFCHHEMFSEEEVLGSDRAMNLSLAGEFLKKKEFSVIDYKLTIAKVSGSCLGNPLGLFLFEDPWDESLVVCAHVQFPEDDTSRVGRLDLIRYNKSISLNLLCFELEYAGELLNTNTKKGDMIPVAQVPNCKNPDYNDPSHWIYWKWEKNAKEEFSDLATRELKAAVDVGHDKMKEVECAMELVTRGYEFVECQGNEWNDKSKWDMKDSFAGKSRLKERSLYMTQYLEAIKDYDIPTVE